MTSLASVLPFLGAKNPSSAKQGMRDSSTRTPRGARRAMDDGSNRNQLSACAARRGPAFGRSQTTADARSNRKSRGDRMGESERHYSGGRRGNDRMGESERHHGSTRRGDRSERRGGSTRRKETSPVPGLERTGTRTVTLATGTHRK